MTEDRAGEFGNRLRKARERRGLSLREIANATKIPIGTLQALEGNDLSRLPGGIFTRGFVRSYALQVGLDPEPLLKDFIAQLAEPTSGISHPALSPVEDEVAIESDQKTASTFLRMILISVPVAGALLYFGTVGRPSTSAVPPAAATTAGAAVLRMPAITLRDVATVASIPPGVSASGPATAAPPLAVPTIPPVDPAVSNRLTAVLLATSPARVTAIVDGKTVFDRELAAGDRQDFDIGRELVLTVSDPSSVELTLNGGKAQQLGPAGETATTHLTLTNYKDYLAP